MKTDIEIAQQAEMEPIVKVAERIGVSADDLELYGKYKAKISDEYLKSIEGNPDGKLILVTAINPTPAGEGKTTTTVGLGEAFGRNYCLKRALLRSLFRYQGRRGRRRLCTGRSHGGSEPALYRRFPCHYLCQ